MVLGSSKIIHYTTYQYKFTIARNIDYPAPALAHQSNLNFRKTNYQQINHNELCCVAELSQNLEILQFTLLCTSALTTFVPKTDPFVFNEVL